MIVHIRPIFGNWDAGFALDKHIISSEFLGNNEAGYPQFNTTRTEVGESVYQLKYRQDWSQAVRLADQISRSILPLVDKVGLIVPMPPSVTRSRQPVTEVSLALGRIAEIPVFEGVLTKTASPAGATQLKNMNNKADKLTVLEGRFVIEDEIKNSGSWNVLLIDDLFDTGASMEAACSALRTYSKLKHIYVVALTWK
jgi:predicted amidophosphoribosyltransferase